MLFTKIQESNDFPTRRVNSRSSVMFLTLNTPIGLSGAESKIFEPEIILQKFTNVANHNVFNLILIKIYQKLYSHSNTNTRCVLNANMLLQYLWAKSE
jgi:hypothetical protein